MRKLLLLASFSLLAKSIMAAGNSVPLTVSSGTYTGVDMYLNSDGANRQAIVVGDLSSSDTVRVDNITGMRVSLSTSALTDTVGVRIQAGTTAIPIAATGTITVNGTVTANQGTQDVRIVSTGTVPISGTITANQGTQGYLITSTNTLNVLDNRSSYLIVSTNTLTVSGTVTANQGTQAYLVVSTNPWTVTNGSNQLLVTSTGTQTVSGTVTANQGTQDYRIVSTGTVTVAGTVTTNQGTQAVLIQSTTTIPVSGSFSATTNFPSTGTINAVVPGYAEMVGAKGDGGNVAHFRVDSSSYLYVNVAAGGAAGGTSSNFGSVFPGPGTAAGFVNVISGAMQGALVNTSSAVVVTNGSNPFLVTSTAPIVTGTNNIGTVSGSTVTVLTTAGGNFPVTVNNTPAVSQSGTWTVQPGNTQNANAWLVISTNTQVQGMTASNSANANNPVKFAVVATSNTPTFVNEGVSGFIADARGTRSGALVTVLDCPREQIVKSSNTITTSTTETVILSSGAASVFNDLLEMVAINTSATASRIDIRSGGGQLSGTIDFALYIPAGETRGFTTPHPWPQTNAASNWTAASSASVTDIRIYGIFCKSK